MTLYILGGIVVCVVLLGICCGDLWKRARHERHWWPGLVVAAMAIVGYLMGVGYLLSLWIYYAVALVGGYALFFLLDLTSGYFWQPKDKPERTITLKDGSQAVVDSKQGKGFQRV